MAREDCLMRLRDILLAGVLALGAACAGAQGIKIGFVDGYRIENESVTALKLIEALKKEFAPRERQLQDMQKQVADLQARLEKGGAKMKPTEREARERELNALAQRFEQARRGFVEDLELRKREARGKVIEDANIVIKSIAEAEKFDLVLQDAVFHSRQIDITEKVLKAMAKRPVPPLSGR